MFLNRSVQESSKVYPKVLVICGEPFNTKSATGITLSNLFREWPKDRLAQIYSADIQPDYDVCEKSWRISNKDLVFVRQTRNILNLKKTVLATNVNPSVNKTVAVAKKTNHKSLIIRKTLVPLIDLVPYQLSSETLSQIEAFKPDIIYSLLGSVRIVRLVNNLSERYAIPVVAHFMDDWLTTDSIFGRSITATLQRVILNRRTHQTLKKSSIGLSIGDAMADEYGQRFGIPFSAFMNPVTLPKDDFQRSYQPKDEVAFIYVGGMHLGRYENLIEIGQAIANVRKQGVRARLAIYAPSADIEQYRAELMNDGVDICGTIAPHEVQNVLLGADVAVHVESFLDQYSCYTRLSVSTKLPQYCAAALPILAYCPSHVASGRYVHDNQCGIAVGSQSIPELEEAIRRLASNSERRQQLGVKALSVAQERHDEFKERKRFQQVLAKAAFRTP